MFWKWFYIMSSALFSNVILMEAKNDNFIDQSKPVRSCEEIKMKCALRTACGGAMQRYFRWCGGILDGSDTTCSNKCVYATVALMTTEEGKDLMICKCSDEFCRESKKRMEICRPKVIERQNSKIQNCLEAEWICMADTLCMTAFQFYHHLCKSVFKGKKCSHRCKNSISVLARQDMSVNLKTCVCEGEEMLPCRKAQYYMSKLCFKQKVDYETMFPDSKKNGAKDAGNIINSFRISDYIILIFLLIYFQYFEFIT